MTTIEITLISAAILIAIALWLLTPYRCRKCRTVMLDSYGEFTGKSWKICPKYGHKELVGEEDDNEDCKD